AVFHKWSGQCADCKSWNSLQESVTSTGSSRKVGYAGENSGSQICNLTDITAEHEVRLPSGISELDRVLGAGFVEGSVVLIGGDPGIGKSTLLTQTMANLSQQVATLYISGEESADQISLRAARLDLQVERLRLLTETSVERILALAANEKPKVMVVDSIQTMYTEQLQSAPGGVAQVRESTALLVRFAKHTGTTVILVGHVTKDGTLAGPRVLEHMVDTVLYFEGEADSQFRLIRTMKNRFGAVNELGLFAMTDKGLKAVSNPSAIFLSRHSEPVSGSAILVTREGSRPLLVEAQALVDSSPLSNPRRVTLGLEQNRLSMLLAVLHRHAGIAMYDQDVYVNVVGGVRITETAADLPVLMAVISSLRDTPLQVDLAAFGEVGLSGEIRPVPSGQERIREAVKHGFQTIVVPWANRPRDEIKEVQIIAVKRLSEVLDLF
ncbi:MAG TPA: DNA repair protein RadA, partial [Gammaproteobacteria bacterium]|nr:DNA repair protein RadA [Gammaproteobacteria bacterium]